MAARNKSRDLEARGGSLFLGLSDLRFLGKILFLKIQEI